MVFFGPPNITKCIVTRSKFCLQTHGLRLLSTVPTNEAHDNAAVKAKPPPKAKPSKKRASVASNMQEFFDSKPCLTLVSGFIPERFVKMKKTPSYYSFIVDDEVAAKYAALIIDELKGDIPVIESNPGLGLVTRHLLKSGLPRITVFDQSFHPQPPLKQLMNDNPERVSIIPSNLFEVYKCMAQDKLDNGDRFSTMFKDFQFKAWTDEPALKVVGCLCTPYYLHSIMKSIAFEEAIVKIGRIQHFLVLNDFVYEKLVSNTNPRGLRNNTLFDLFFDLEVKAQFPRIACLPWDKGKRNKDIKERSMVLVKLTPKADIYERFGNSNLKVLWYFLQDLGRSRHLKVLGYFERWVPWSGLKLIKEGLSPQTEVQDLTLSEILKLYFTFTSLPEFSEANYIHIQESGVLTDVFEQSSSTKEKKIFKIGFS